MAHPGSPDPLAGGVGSASGTPGVPARTGPFSAFFGWLIGTRPAPLPGIADYQPEDVKEHADWTNFLNLPPPEGEGENTGICCSGGGIRAASFCLGGLEALQDAQLFARTKYLSAVSGGGYIAVAQAALRGLTREHAAADTAQANAASSAARAAAARAHRIAAAANAAAAAAAHSVDASPMTDAIASTASPALEAANRAAAEAVAEAVANARAAAAAAAHAQDNATGVEDSMQALPPWSLSAPETVNLRNHTTYLAPDLNGKVWGGAVVLFGAIQHLLPFAALTVVLGTFYGRLLRVIPGVAINAASGSLTFNADLARIALYVCSGGLGFAALLVAGRQLLGLRVTRSLTRRWPSTYAALEIWTVRVILLSLIATFLLCLIPVVFAQIRPDWHLVVALVSNLSLASILPVVTRGSRVASSTAVRRVVVVVAAYVAGPLVLAVSFLLMAYIAAVRVHWLTDFGPVVWIALSAIYLLLVWLLDDEVAGPMHLLYRERLSTAFIRFRVKIGASIATAEPPWDEAVNFSGLDLDGMPNLVVCAAVNVADDVVPPGRFAGSFTFEQDYSGGPLTGYIPTAELQTAAGDGVLTLPAMMAIAGAAFSPLMGRTTRPGWRLLFALFDVRLGVWLPNPRHLSGYLTARQIRRPPARTNDAFSAFPAAPRAPLKRFANGKPPPRRLRPGWSYALREAFGFNSLRLPYVYVTDGGHFENLGLVELLRRGCTQIICFDASEDDKEPLTALGQAIALARDELGVDICIDTSEIWPGSAKASDKRLTKQMVAEGVITYPNQRKGVLIFVKNHLPEGAPRDVLSYAETDKHFPFDSTLNQFFDDQRFDAYRELGYFGAKQAVAKAQAHHWRAPHPTA